MKADFSRWDAARVLNAAIVAGIVAIFLAIATPLVRGAVIRQRTAECARKIIQAADAFDFYAGAFGYYPQSQRDARETEKVMTGAFAVFDIDWWESATELGGEWGWFNNGKTSSVVISGDRISERKMVLLDQLLDDGDLESGLFRRCCSRYHYFIKERIL
jgi:hypothetical protein